MNIILHMGDAYPNESPAAKRMQAFQEVLTNRGHSVTVMAPRFKNTVTKAENTVYCPTIELKKKTTLLRMLNQLSFAFSSILLCKKAGKADVVLTTSPPVLISMAGWFIAKVKKAKLVYDVRDIWPDVALEMGSFTETSLFCKVFSFIRDFMLKHADLVTAVSPGKVTKLQSYPHKSKIAYITNGLDEHFLENEFHQEVAEKYGLCTGFNCVYIGNIGWAQGLNQLMDLAQRVKENNLNVRFILFGSGVEEESLQQYAKVHCLDNVVFAGRLPNQEMYTILKSAQLSFVSLVNNKLKDSVPTKIFEALGVGCPVLLAAVGDSADILNQCKLGIATPPNDLESLWNAFLKIYSAPQEYMQYREHTISVIKNEYSRQKASLQLETALLDILNNTKQ